MLTEGTTQDSKKSSTDKGEKKDDKTVPQEKRKENVKSNSKTDSTGTNIHYERILYSCNKKE